MTITILAFSVYAVVPTILIWFFHFRGFKHGSPNIPSISLTFDEIADPSVMQKTLMILRQHQVKATFFFSGRTVAELPQIVKQILAEGHEVGMKNYEGSNNWLMTPKKSRQQVKRTVQVFQQVMGQVPYFYRPPMGWVNLYQLLRFKRPFALWSVRHPRVGLGQLPRIVRKIRNGSIISLRHRPNFTNLQELETELLLLSSSLEVWKRQGYQFKTVHELFNEERQEHAIKRRIRTKINRLMFRLWKKWERTLHRLLRLESVYGERHSIFRIRRRRYYGPPLTLPDGVILKKGDLVGELHLNNEMMIAALERAKSPVQLAAALVKEARQSMPVLSRFVMETEKYRDIKAVYGITMIYRGADPLGFMICDIKESLFGKVATLYLRMYMSVMHPKGKGRLKERRALLVPKRVVMSRAMLLEKYGEDEPDTGAHSSASS
jgi:peptidoglycan/xylan/chitin deacetylase (PgdA/CDA1 family)